MRGSQSKQKLTALYTPAGVYYGEDTLEGFTKDAEMLGKFVEESSEYDNYFYRLCIQDDQFIFDFTSEECMKIPKM